ncbi:hypothetical protein B0H13DRAFT_2524870 [Mycena leptocephala]|nr:hypothetical protein B0H13DRAFT_2524870 [Mycena leptocephala]
MTALAKEVDASLLAYMRSAEFSHLPPLSDRYWESVKSLKIPPGCRSSPFDVYAIQGKRIFEHALLRGLGDTDELLKKPLGYVTFVEMTLGANELLREVFSNLDQRALLDGVLAVRDGFFAFVGAHWNQAFCDTEFTTAWLLCIFGPMIQIIGKLYMKQYVSHNNLWGDSSTTRLASDHRKGWDLRTPKLVNPTASYSFEIFKGYKSLWWTPILHLTRSLPSHPKSKTLPRKSDPRRFLPPAMLQIPEFDQWSLSPLSAHGAPPSFTRDRFGQRRLSRFPDMFWPASLPGQSSIGEELKELEYNRECHPPAWSQQRSLQPAFQVIYLSAIVDILTSHFEFPDARFLSGVEPRWRQLADSDRDDVVELFLDFDHLQIREPRASAINRGGLLPLRRPLSSHNTTCAPMSVVEKGKGREPTSLTES